MNDERRRFETLALPHLDAAYNLARWLARQPADADDIVQDAMLRAFRAFAGFRGEEIRPWLLAIVRNCAMTAAGKIRWRREDSLPGEGEMPQHRHLTLVAAEPDPEIVAIGADIGRNLSALVAQLPDEFREVLILREMEDLSYKEIAEITGTPIGTVMSRLARARALLRERWPDKAEGRTQNGLR
jgi:RNA polymerase sigma-70 factor (ECF subfamily)